VNAGLRWDFTGASLDKQAAYHNADLSSLYGPTGIGNLFKPGVLKGNMNPTLEERPQPYNNWYVTPQPSLGIAWAPRFQEGVLRKFMGENDTVIRAGISLRRFTVPYQYFWNNASDYGSFFYQFYTATARNVPGAGSFPPAAWPWGNSILSSCCRPRSTKKSSPWPSLRLTTASTTTARTG